MPTPQPPTEPYRPNAPHHTPLGIMQGRLVPPDQGRFQSFPRLRWRDEFPRAVASGIDYIEWIVDAYGEDFNPALTPEGRAELAALKHQHNIATPAVCADWFMDYPLLRCSCAQLAERELFLHRLVPIAQAIGADHIVLPFVDISRIQSEAEQQLIVEILDRAAPIAAEYNVELHLETDLAPAAFAALLDRIPHSMIKANYDSGNSSGLGYIATEEFAAYGERIGSIHIKDRYRKPEGGIETRALGLGSADFVDVFNSMHRVGYNRGITLQTARGHEDDEVAWIRAQAAFVRTYWE
jgi:L-ribulose-5-phosphate 3-epimerase